MSASYTNQEVIALIGRVLNHYHLSGEHFLFNRTATGLEVLTTPTMKAGCSFPYSGGCKPILTSPSWMGRATPSIFATTGP